MRTRYHGTDLSRALLDPASIFESPDELLRLGSIPNDLKVGILCSWAYDASELAVAEEEGISAHGGEICACDSCIEGGRISRDSLVGTCRCCALEELTGWIGQADRLLVF